MRILVTGAAGYIAKWLIPELQGAGHEVFGTDSQSYFGGELEDDEFETADLRDPAMIDFILRWSEPEIVVHLAALYGRIQGEKKLIETVRTNAGMVAELARACKQHGAFMAYVSSSEVYGAGPSWDRPTKTIDACLPLNMYGWSKLWGEKAVEHYCDDYVIMRLNMPYGPGLRVSDLGYNALHTFLWQAHHEKPIFVHKGTLRTYTWVGDTARGMRMIVESGETGRFNVCRDDAPWTTEAVAELACTVVGRGEDKITYVDPPGDVTPRKTFDNQRLLSLGWEPTVEFRQGAEIAYAWVKTIPAEGWTG